MVSNVNPHDDVCDVEENDTFLVEDIRDDALEAVGCQITAMATQLTDSQRNCCR